MAWRYRLGQSSTRRHQRDVEKDDRRLTPNGGFKNTKMARHRSAKRADGSSRVWRCVGEWIRCAAGIRNADMSILRKNWTRTLSENIRSAGKRRNISSSIKTKQATAVELRRIRTGGSARGSAYCSAIRTSRNIDTNPGGPGDHSCRLERASHSRTIDSYRRGATRWGVCWESLSAESGSTTSEAYSSASSQLTGRALDGALLDEFNWFYLHPISVTRYKTASVHLKLLENCNLIVATSLHRSIG